MLTDAGQAALTYENGSNVAITSYGKLYDGNGVSADNFRISAKGTSAKDYTKKIVDSDGKTVSEAVSAGDYKLVATSKRYKLTGTTEMPVTIKKVDLTTLKAANRQVERGLRPGLPAPQQGNHPRQQQLQRTRGPRPARRHR